MGGPQAHVNSKPLGTPKRSLPRLHKLTDSAVVKLLVLSLPERLVFRKARGGSPRGVWGLKLAYSARSALLTDGLEVVPRFVMLAIEKPQIQSPGPGFLLQMAARGRPFEMSNPQHQTS